MNPTSHTCETSVNVGPHVRGNSCPLLGESDGTSYCGDSVYQYGHTFDKCGGHADRLTGVYHYHTTPICLLNQLLAIQSSSNTTSDIEYDLGQVSQQDSTEYSILNQEAYVTQKPPSGSSGSFSMQHSPQLGWALDGFPIYGPRGMCMCIY